MNFTSETRDVCEYRVVSSFQVFCLLPHHSRPPRPKSRFKKFLETYLTSPPWTEPDPTTRYFHSFVDLNGDGKPEVIFYISGRMWCGSGGCPTLVLLLSSSSYRQSFCFLVREEELTKTLEALESALALELAHHYVNPINVDRDVGLLAAVGEDMAGKPGLAGRIFTAISRAHVNVIAIAQGSSELTIAVVVQRAGPENAVRAVHAECGLGTTMPRNPARAPN